MAKFNQTKEKSTYVTSTHEGGCGVQKRTEHELLSILCTGISSNFYETESDREKRIFELAKKLALKDPVLLAKMIVYVRSVVGQRTSTHVASVAAARYLSGHPIAKKLFTKRSRKDNSGGVVYRIDDMMEILSYYYLRNSKKSLPNSMKRGFKSVLENSEKYELAKYQARNKKVSLVDVVNLVHPKPSDKMKTVFFDLMNGLLKQFDTAEDKQTKSGQIVSEKVKSGELSKEDALLELNSLKADNWKELIETEKIGYLSLLRNLKNISELATDEVFKKALLLLTNEKRIRDSLVFPHQIDIAFEVVLNDTTNNINTNRKNILLTAINTAYELSIPNLTTLFKTGRTAVVVDVSGSMTSCYSNIGGKRINSSVIEKAGLIAATLCKGVNADLYEFDNVCRKSYYNPVDSINTTKSIMVRRATGGGTNFGSIFKSLDSNYDRVFVISDMQGSDSLIRSASYLDWVKKSGNPYIYSIDLTGHSTTMFKESNKLIQLYGYSKDIYEFIKVAEIDPFSLMEEIEKIEL